MSCSARLPLYMLLIGVFFSKPLWLPGLALFGMYSIGLITAPLVALVLKRTLLRGATPIFVMELPSFKWPQAKTVVRRMVGAGWAFVYRAGTFIFASMILVWALLYFPSNIPDSERHESISPDIHSYDELTAQLKKEIDDLNDELGKINQKDPEQQEVLAATRDKLEKKEDEYNKAYGDWRRQSLLGQAGKTLEPVFAPLGWDWRIGMAALASFPAREVVVGTVGIIYNQGDVDPKEIRKSKKPGDTPLGRAVRQEWADEKDSPRSEHPTAVALSLLVFFALCCQCASTLAVIRRETSSWWWPAFTFVYMTVLAYVGAFAVYQIGRLFL
jgi:ferrous iron transport protein B